LQECKDLLGKFGQVEDKVFFGGQIIVHLTNSLVFQNGEMHHFVINVIYGGRMTHTGENHANIFTYPVLLENLQSYDDV